MQHVKENNGPYLYLFYLNYMTESASLRNKGFVDMSWMISIFYLMQIFKMDNCMYVYFHQRRFQKWIPNDMNKSTMAKLHYCQLIATILELLFLFEYFFFTCNLKRKIDTNLTNHTCDGPWKKGATKACFLKNEKLFGQNSKHWFYLRNTCKIS